MMKFAAMPLWCFLAVFATADEGKFPLIQNGKPAAQIVAPAEIGKHVEAFNRALGKCTGSELPVAAARTGSGPAIVFELKELPLDKDDAFSITFPDEKTLKISGSPRSARWALNAILEKYAGVVRCFPGERGSYYPPAKNLVLPRQELKGDAGLKLSRFFTREDPEWLLDVNGKQLNKIDFVIGHNVGLLILPPSRYAQGEWRDKIMPLRNGKRLAIPPRDTHGWQPCYSHPESVSEAVKNICAYLAKHPETKFFSLTINDVGGFCECESCLRVNLGKRKNKLFPQQWDWSDVYFQWCNAVAGEVSRKYPDVFFGTLAYCETATPPPFRLHEKIVVALTMDLHTHMKPGRFESDLKNMEEWSRKASNLGIWEYGFTARDYSVPRLPWNLYARGLRALKANHGNFFFCESAPLIGEGPKRWLYLKLAWDVQTDPDRLVSEWCAACVGKEAGKYLEQYYRWCRDFWTSERVGRTPWIRSAGLYFAFTLNGSYLLALRPEDLENSRMLMDKMLAEAKKSGDPDQQYRAERLRRFYDFHETMAYLGGGGLIPLERKAKTPANALADVDTAAEACALLEAVPRIMKRIKALPDVIADINADGFSGLIDNTRISVGPALPGVFLNPAFRWRNDPSVRPLLAKTAADATLPEAVRKQLKDILDFEKLPDLPGNLSDAEELALWDITQPGMKIELDKSGGKRRIKVTKNTSWAAVRRKIPSADPLHSYAVEAVISAPADAVGKDSNTRMILCSSPNFEYTTVHSDSTEFYPQTPGKSVKMSLATVFPAKAYSGFIYFIWNGMDNGKCFFIEDIRVKELGSDPPFTGKPIGSWEILRPQKNLAANGSAFSGKNLSGISFLHSNDRFEAERGKRFRIVAPVKGKGVFRIGIAAFDKTGRMIATHHGQLIKADTAGQWNEAKFEDDIPVLEAFEKTDRIAVRLDLRSGDLDFDNVRILFFQAEK
ncbi:MAG: hypothetical protein BWY31_03805 [Lentisphaerae bacterium ADurb.Bin242]|nr:MAG: hypothetical protein BWY31_03805 [Lentisphaerae bacterium ADurb.Bin242]